MSLNESVEAIVPLSLRMFAKSSGWKERTTAVEVMLQPLFLCPHLPKKNPLDSSTAHHILLFYEICYFCYKSGCLSGIEITNVSYIW
jgi:hypothetical protein